MKVSPQQVSDGLACPSCGAMVGQGLPSDEPADPAGGVEVIRGGGAASGRPAEEVEELNLEDELDEPDELDPLPPGPGQATSSVSAARLPAAEKSIPAPRREEYKTPQLISGVGGRAWTPGFSEEKPKPKFDKGKLASTSDERLAADPEAEEGAVQVHVARKIAEWDLDDDDKDPQVLPAERGADGASWRGQIAMFGIAAVIALFLGLIIYGLFQSLREKEVVIREMEKLPEELAREAMSSVERDAMDRAEETFAAAGEAIENFLNAADYKERLPFVRDAARVEPLMEAYYQANPDGPIPFRAPEKGWGMRPYKSFLLTVVVSEDYSQNAIAVERQSDGKYLVDWESFVGYSEVPWDEFMEQRPLEPVLLRVRASVADYYNFGFDSEDGWACIELKDKPQRHTLYGYVKQDDPVLKDLMKVMSLHGTSHITIRVAYPPDAKAPNQVLVKEVVSQGWVFSEDGDEAEDGDGQGAGGA